VRARIISSPDKQDFLGLDFNVRSLALSATQRLVNLHTHTYMRLKAMGRTSRRDEDEDII
jgi:hypothetical protein